MRLAVYENLPPGGALRTSYQIGLELVRRGYEIDLFRLSTYAHKGAFDLANEATAVHVVPYRPLWGTLDARLRGGHLAPRAYTLFGPLKRLHRRLATEMSSQRYDAVLVHPDAMTYAPYVLRWLKDVPTVYYCQEPPRVAVEMAVREQHRANLGRSPYGLGAVRLLEDRLVMDRLIAADSISARHATVIAVNSIYSRERAWAAYARDAVVCYLGIDPERFIPPVSPTARRREVLSIGSPIVAKNHLLVIHALALIAPRSRPALRVILPRGDGSEGLVRAAGERGVEITIDTNLDEAGLIERYQSALATVCASRLEPFGLTTIESMACGTPVVAINEAGYRESVADGVTGILADPNAEGLGAAIGLIAEDEAQAANMGAAGRRHVLEHWTWQQTVTRLEHILEEAVHTA